VTSRFTTNVICFIVIEKCITADATLGAVSRGTTPAAL